MRQVGLVPHSEIHVQDDQISWHGIGLEVEISAHPTLEEWVSRVLPKRTTDITGWNDVHCLCCSRKIRGTGYLCKNCQEGFCLACKGERP